MYSAAPAMAMPSCAISSLYIFSSPLPYPYYFISLAASSIPKPSSSGKSSSGRGRNAVIQSQLLAADTKDLKLKPDSNVIPNRSDSAGGVARNVGDPLGQKALGRAVVRWIARGMKAMATEIANAEKTLDYDLIRQKLSLGTSLVVQAKPYVEANSPPEGFEELCQKAMSHYPTLFDHLQRELQNALLMLQQQGFVVDWEQSESWKWFKKQTKSGDHRGIARHLPRAKEVQNELGLTAEKVAEVQDNINNFAGRFLKLLHIERVAELSSTDASLESIPSATAVSPGSKAGDYVFDSGDVESVKRVSISKIKALSSSTGLGGLHLVRFQTEAGQHLPPAISPGDMVRIQSSGANSTGNFEGLQGTVYSVGENGSSIEVALAARFGNPAVSKLFGNLLQIDKIPDLANTITFERNCAALEELKIQGLKKRSPAASVVATLFGEGSEICQIADNCPRNLGSTYLDAAIGKIDGFDDSQIAAINSALNRHKPLVIIQGPPGTGKTRVVVEVIVRAVSRGEKILATGPTNAAVDNLVERLATANINIVRIGNPVRMAPSILGSSLGVMVKARLSKCEQEIARKRTTVRRNLRHCASKSEDEAGLRQTLKQLGKSYKQKEQETINEILRTAQVILSTNTGAGDPLLKNLRAFDLVVVDEAGQAIEPACWIAILKGKRTLLAGDIHQLAPLVISKQALEGGLGISLMERASKLHGGIMNTILAVQYRMHDAIARWASRELYGGILQSASSVSSHLLRDSPSVQATWITTLPLLLLDTRMPRGNLMAGCEECLDPAGTGSFYNEGEADIVIDHVKALLAAVTFAERGF
ncbi:hypothetical protein O6H91_Y369500 [Diphasiastrum complanatum]|nr:hypothetical protein O6H91_Y369500 [Diphasiastrum complanatum]